MARIINQNNEVIATKDENKASVSKSSLFVGIVLAGVAIAILVILIVFLTKKEKANNNSNTTPLLQYIDNYKGSSNGGNKIQLLQEGDVKYVLENYKGECYILIYDVTWMTQYDTKSDAYKSFSILDSYLTGSKRIDGKEETKDPMLKAIENCGKDVRFFVVDYNSVKKRDEDLKKNPVYFTMSNGVEFSNIKAPMFFHYKNDETYSSMTDTEKGLYIADGNTKPTEWGSKIKKEINYLNGLDNED